MMQPWNDCEHHHDHHHHQYYNHRQQQQVQMQPIIPAETFQVEGYSSGYYVSSGDSAGVGGGSLPVGFYTDREIRNIWDGQFELLRRQLSSVLQTSADYAMEGAVWLESNAGLSRLDDATEGRIRLLTGGLPPLGEYGSMWGSSAPLTQQVLLPQLLPGTALLIPQSVLLQMSMLGYSFYDGAKVRFRCSQCPKEWTSMKGRIVFHLFRVESPVPLVDPQSSEVLLHPGYNLCFKLFKQQCHESRGHHQGDLTVFEEPQWYPEEIEKVLYNVFWRIGQTLYRVSIGSKHVQMWRRAGNPSQQHDKTGCQACQLGFCQGKAK